MIPPLAVMMMTLMLGLSNSEWVALEMHLL
jgi:hypothetical protein